MTAPTRAETAALREALAEHLDPAAFRLARQCDYGSVFEGYARARLAVARENADDLIAGPLASVLTDRDAALAERDEARAESALRKAQVRILSDQRLAAEAETAALKARVAALEAARCEIDRLTTPRSLNEYHEDHGFVLWWKLPAEEPPYVGGPNCDDWPGYHTHWTPLLDPIEAARAALSEGATDADA